MNLQYKRYLFYTLFLIYEQHFTSVARNLWNWSLLNVFSTFVNESLFDAVQSNLAANRNWKWVNMAPNNLVACAKCAQICAPWTLLIQKAPIKLYCIFILTNILSCLYTWALGNHAKQIACGVQIAWFCTSLCMEVLRKLKLNVRKFVWGRWEVFCRLQNGRRKKSLNFESGNIKNSLDIDWAAWYNRIAQFSKFKIFLSCIINLLIINIS